MSISKMKFRNQLFFTILTALIIIFVISPVTTYQKEQEIIRIPPEEANQLIQENKESFSIFILDLRTYEDWMEERLDNSVNLNELVLENQEDSLILNKDKAYLVYSQNEEKSIKNEKVINIMKDLDLKKIYYLEGGIEAWIKQGFFTVSFKTIEPEEAFALIKKNNNNSDFVIIDLRTAEQRRMEFIKNSIQIDFKKEDFLATLNALNRNKTYLIHCKVGSIGIRTLGKMEQQGFKKVYNIKGGIINWIKKGFPVIKE